jgi:hypothetical protein
MARNAEDRVNWVCRLRTTCSRIQTEPSGTFVERISL